MSNGEDGTNPVLHEELLDILAKVTFSVNRLIQEKISANVYAGNEMALSRDLRVRNLLHLLVVACREENLEQSRILLDQMTQVLTKIDTDKDRS